MCRGCPTQNLPCAAATKMTQQQSSNSYVRTHSQQVAANGILSYHSTRLLCHLSQLLGHGTRKIDDSQPDRDLDSETEVVPGIACQKGRFGKSPVSLRHGENVQGEPARHVHHAAPGLKKKKNPRIPHNFVAKVESPETHCGSGSASHIYIQEAGTYRSSSTKLLKEKQCCEENLTSRACFRTI